MVLKAKIIHQVWTFEELVEVIRPGGREAERLTMNGLQQRADRASLSPNVWDVPRRRRVVTILASVVLVVTWAAVVFAAEAFGWGTLAFLLAAAVLGPIHAAVSWWQSNFPCPWCGRPFSGRGWLHWWDARCRYCHLRWSETMPAPKFHPINPLPATWGVKQASTEAAPK
jgi:hypothetical protein